MTMMENQPRGIRALGILACEILQIEKLHLHTNSRPSCRFSGLGVWTGHKRGTLLCSRMSGVSAGRLVGWRLESSEGLFTHTARGWCWLLACGLSSYPPALHQMASPHRLDWASSQHSDWVPSTRILRERAFYNLASEVSQCHFHSTVFIKLLTESCPGSRGGKKDFTS